MRQTETELSKAIAATVRMKYPNTILRFDMAGSYMPEDMRVFYYEILNKEQAGYPDIFLAEPRHGKAGLYIELKTLDSVDLKRNGGAARQHSQTQKAMQDRLRAKGYEVVTVAGYYEAMDKINRYMAGRAMDIFDAAPADFD
jgi:hypothetical protein